MNAYLVVNGLILKSAVRKKEYPAERTLQGIGKPDLVET
jgi:hypothetical protein